MNDLYICIREIPKAYKADMPAALSRWMNSDFVRITKSGERIYFISCDRTDYGAKPISRIKGHASFGVSGLITSGSLPKWLADGKHRKVTKCLYQGRNAVYLTVGKED